MPRFFFIFLPIWNEKLTQENSFGEGEESFIQITFVHVVSGEASDDVDNVTHVSVNDVAEGDRNWIFNLFIILGFTLNFIIATRRGQ